MGEGELYGGQWSIRNCCELRQRFSSLDPIENAATHIHYSSSRAAPDAEWEKKVMEAMSGDENINYIKLQMCENLNKDKCLASVSRIIQARHSRLTHAR